MTTTSTPPEAPTPETYNLPPEGWLCTRGKGHDGPCAAVPLPIVELTEQRNEALSQLKVMAEELEEATVAHAIADNARIDALRERDNAEARFTCESLEASRLRKQLTDALRQRDEAQKERDEAIKEAGRRDEKWMMGVEDVCGRKLEWNSGFNHASALPDLHQFIESLRSARDTARAEVAKLREAIQNEPCGTECSSYLHGDRACDCWKSRALQPR